MLQIFFLNLYFTATTLKFHTYSLKFFGVQSKWLIKVFVFILFFFLIFFLSKFCARDFSNIIGPLYSKSLCTDDWTWSKLFGCFMLSLPVPIYLADFWNFLRPIVCSCKLSYMNHFFRRGWRCAPYGYLTQVAQFVDLAMARKLSVNFKSKSSYLFIGIFLSIDNLSKHI